MTKYIALLKAINVGGHTVKMDYLKKLFENMGFTRVETFIASGNVIFDTKIYKTELIKIKIEKQLKTAFGYTVRTFIRSTEELKAIANYKPYTESDLDNKQNYLYIGFLNDVPNKDSLKKVLALSNEANVFYFNNKELYWLCRKNFINSGISGKLLEKSLGMETTIRNSTTIQKMAIKFSS
jgi:uncharacterized protein (DUF1697 family)